MQSSSLASKAYSFRRQDGRSSIGTLLQIVNRSNDQDENILSLQILNTLNSVSIPIRQLREAVGNFI